MHRVESVLVERHVWIRFDDEFRRDVDDESLTSGKVPLEKTL